jgi:hypothetical protein
MKTLAMIIVVLTLTSCSKVQIGNFEWDPKTAMMRATFGVSKWTQQTVKAVAVCQNLVSGLTTLTIAWIVYDNERRRSGFC